MSYLTGYLIAHPVLFFPHGAHLYEVARLRNGTTEVIRAVRQRIMAS